MIETENDVDSDWNMWSWNMCTLRTQKTAARSQIAIVAPSQRGGSYGGLLRSPWAGGRGSRETKYEISHFECHEPVAHHTSGLSFKDSYVTLTTIQGYFILN